MADADYASIGQLDVLAHRLTTGEKDTADYFLLFDRLLHLLDHEDSEVAEKAQTLLETVICDKGLSKKEQLLKASEALTWYCEGPRGVTFLLITLTRSLDTDMSEARARAETANVVHGVTKAIAAAKFDTSLLASAMAPLCDVLLRFDASSSVLPMVLGYIENARLVNVEEFARIVAKWMRALELSDGRSVYLLNAVTSTLGLGQHLLRCCVLSRVETLVRASQYSKVALTEFVADSESEALLFRATQAMLLLRRLIDPLALNCLTSEHQWLVPLLQTVIDFCVRCPDQIERASAWAVVERTLSAMTEEMRASSLAQLLASPFGTVASLLCTRVKNELLANQEFWWPKCVENLFPLIFVVPSDDSELNARRDSILAAVNLLLFLTIRQKNMSPVEGQVISGYRRGFLAPLEKLLQARISQARLPKNVESHNEMLQKMEPGKEWTQESLDAATRKMLVADELLYSAVERIRVFE